MNPEACVSITSRKLCACMRATYEQHCIHKVRTYKDSVYAPRRNWDSPNPFLACECAPSPQKQGGGGTLACGWGVGGESEFRRGAYTVVLFICTYFVITADQTLSLHFPVGLFCGFIFMVILGSKENKHNFFLPAKVFLFLYQ